MKTKRASKTIKRNFLNVYFNSVFGDAKRKKIKELDKMKDLLQEYKYFLGVQYNRQNTIDRYYNATKHFLVHSHGAINRKTVNDYIYYINQNKKRNTVVSEIVGLNKFLRYIGKPKLCIPTPNGEDIYRDTITKEEIQKLLRYSRANCHLMDYLIISFITDLDCRPHEIAKTQWTWIKGDKIYFNDCKTGNTYGYLTEELKTNLEIWHRQQFPQSKYIFTNYQGSYKGLPITGQTQKIRDLIHKVTKKVIGRQLNPQDLRASVMTEEFNHYVNPKIIQRKARHRSLKSTMKYNHVDDKDYLEYLNTGTIFNNTGPIFKEKPKFPHDNGGYI